VDWMQVTSIYGAALSTIAIAGQAFAWYRSHRSRVKVFLDDYVAAQIEAGHDVGGARWAIRVVNRSDYPIQVMQAGIRLTGTGKIWFDIHGGPRLGPTVPADVRSHHAIVLPLAEIIPGTISIEGRKYTPTRIRAYVVLSTGERFLSRRQTFAEWRRRDEGLKATKRREATE
jgi:hypothetical protein